jgi:uncharacterized membrane protein YfcA
MDTMEIVIMALWTVVGFCAAFIGSVLGLGGGVVIVPALYYLSPFVIETPLSIAQAVGTSMTVIVFSSFFSLIKFYSQQRVDVRAALLFFATSGPMTIVGSMWTSAFQPATFELLFGIFLLVMAGLIASRHWLRPLNINWRVKREYTDTHGHVHRYQYGVWPILLIGVCVGLVSGLFGIGGGALMVPLMLILFAYPPHVATATSMLVVFLTALVGASTKMVLGEVHLMSTLALTPGAVVGGWVGAWITGKMRSPLLTQVLSVGFTAFAVYLIAQ